MTYPLADLLHDLARWFNYAEVALWPAMGLTLLVASFKKAGPARRDFRLAAAVLVAFGASDWFEAGNGNEWWHPWWLFVWKAGSVAALLAIVIVALRRERRRRKPTP